MPPEQKNSNCSLLSFSNNGGRSFAPETISLRRDMNKDIKDMLDIMVYLIWGEEERRIPHTELADLLGCADPKPIEEIIRAELPALRLYDKVYKHAVYVESDKTTFEYLLSGNQAIALIVASRSGQSSFAQETLLLMLYGDHPVVCRFLEPDQVEDCNEDNSKVKYH